MASSTPGLNILEACVCERRVGESLYEVATRVLTQEAIALTHTQKEAARLLGVSPRVMNYNAEQLGLRPKDAKLRGEVLDA